MKHFYIPFLTIIFISLSITSYAQSTLGIKQWNKNDFAGSLEVEDIRFQQEESINDFTSASYNNYQSTDTVMNREATTSLTAGYMSDSYNLEMDNGSKRFAFDGELTALMLSSNSASLTLSYGLADAKEHDSDIRSIAADLSLGGNSTIFDDLFGLPLSAYIPIRANLGYRSLTLVDVDEEYDKVNMGNANLGLGVGSSIRLPTNLPIIENNLTGFVSIVRSVGIIGDMSSAAESGGFQESPETGDPVLEGIRYTRGTDFNLEGKLERLLGEKTGVTVGITMRWMSWTNEKAEGLGEITDVIAGNADNIDLRSKQYLFRVGINW
ncbi:hypothetical protein [Gracilimonas mengyeensis]|uniref:Uncharacterized protein n=1 Tax=Gracilimonas mengyeensis TaxID=1302730 RepID=A0A521EVK7_9BACT|nr:hypothetical protein [Gracilimonas mengyeensis]SMO87441.1 hypothetical protein SAMN06265219_113160 [Gracilimonas mengyeensis]